ncbi:hypothetical protein P355_0145 [Burkholderia cenocepacia KC-01]|nr:hypothetical protein P355_0145 [Burkholderia cenocepacia KC-01]
MSASEQPAPITAQAALAAIETFEIVGDNNDSREPNANDRFILTEFIAHAFSGYPVEQHETATVDARAHWKTGTPPTKDGEHREYIVAVRRAHDDRRVFVFAASHANNYADDLHDQDGKEFIADGWYDIGEDPSGEFNTLFTPTLGPDDEVLGWQELPKWSAATSAQLEPIVTNGQQEVAPTERAIDPSEQLINFSGHSLTLTGAQLIEALDFIAPDRDRDQLEGELTFQRGEGHAGNGMYCWVTEYPEEGAIFVDGSTAIPAEAERVPADERAATPIGYIRADDLKELAEGNGAIVSPRCDETGVPVFARAAPANETGAEGANDVTLDRRDLFSFARGAIKSALEDYSAGEGMAASWYWQEATNRTEALLEALDTKSPYIGSPAMAAEAVAYVCSASNDFAPIVRDKGAAQRLSDAHGDGKIVPLYAAPQPAQADARPTDDELWDQALRERDEYHETADKLAAAVAKHFGADIGEHSNANCPWEEALEVIENAAQADDRHALTVEHRAAIGTALDLIGLSPDPRVKKAYRVLRELANQRPEPRAEVTNAARDVLAERRRQVEQEGWTPAHDDQYRDHELSCAAGCYAMHTLAYPAGDPPPAWPWAADWWKPTTHRRNLVKAGALIQAAIERLDRAGEHQ